MIKFSLIALFAMTMATFTLAAASVPPPAKAPAIDLVADAA